MALTPSSVKRSVDATGDEIKTYVDQDGKVVQLTADEMGYVLNDFAEPSATLSYLGKEKPGGEWLVVSMDTTSGISLRYATVLNNPTRTSYAVAWAARSTLTYDTWGTAF